MDRTKKTDRVLRLWLLLLRSPERYSTRQLAEKFNVTARTIYRDLECLEYELRVPVYNSEGKWAVQENYFLPPISFTTAEALCIFLAARLMLGYSHRYDPNVESTFRVLSSVLQAPLGNQVEKTLEWMRRFPRDERRLQNLAKLAEGWTTLHRLKISYQSLPADVATERIIEPYFIEPAAPGHASYVIAYCLRTHEVRTFRIERIQDVEITDQGYTIPGDFDANQHFAGAWGVVTEGEEQDIRLKFKKEIARLIEETIWHPSQKLAKQPDGSLIMNLRVYNSYELVTWIMGWGQKVEVIEPEELRSQIEQTAKDIVKLYSRKPIV